MSAEQDNSITYFISELETERKNINLILKKIIYVLISASGNIVFLGL